MRIKKLQATALAAVLLMYAGVSQAAKVVFTGTIYDVSCQLVPSASSIAVSSSDTGTLKADGDMGRPRAFSIKLSNCDGSPATGKNAYVAINGPTLAGKNTMFNGNAADATRAGIYIASAENPTVALPATDKSLQFSTNADGGVVNLVAGLIASGPTTPGMVTAPVDFTFDIH